MTGIRRILLAWQRQARAGANANQNNSALLLAVPLLLIGVLLTLLGLFTLHGLMLGLGIIGVAAALGLQSATDRPAAQVLTPVFERNGVLRRG